MRARMIILPLLALGVGLYFWQTTPTAQDIPATTWRIGTGTDLGQGQNYDELAAESPIRLSVVCTQPTYVYVFSHSLEDGTLLMFPSPAIRTDCKNPLAAGRTVLPGQREGDEVCWTTRAGIQAVTTYMVLASNEPIAALEDLLPKLRHWSNTVFPDHSMAVTQPGSDVKVTGQPREPLPSALLQLAADIGNSDPNPNGPMKPAAGYPGMYTSSWKVRERKQPPGAKPDGEKK